MITTLIISAIIGGTVGIVAANNCDQNCKLMKSAKRTKKYAADCAEIVGEASVKLNETSKEYAKDIVAILKEDSEEKKEIQEVKQSAKA